MKRLGPLVAVAALSLMTPAHAFVHVVAPGESLAQIAEHTYGDTHLETLLVGANFLDLQGGSSVVPGMRLEVPATSHYTARSGDTWPALALTWLGSAKRADMLARANRAVSWVPPADGQEIELPFVLTHIAAEGDTTTTLARRYLGDANRAWELEAYNDRKPNQGPLRKGDVALVPIFALSLTANGKTEARRGSSLVCAEAGGGALEAQHRADAELPQLLSDVRYGRYIDAVAHGNRILAFGELTRAQFATVHRALLEAFVALDAVGAAAGSCDAWRAHSAAVVLDPLAVSPKIRAACGSH